MTLRVHNSSSKVENNLLRPATVRLSAIGTKCIIDMVRDLGNCSGADVVLLVHFPIILQPVFSIAPNSPSDVIKLLLPLTLGQLFHVWLNVIQVNLGRDKLYTLILSHFFPGIQKRRLEARFVERQQLPTQSFGDFSSLLWRGRMSYGRV